MKSCWICMPVIVFCAVAQKNLTHEGIVYQVSTYRNYYAERALTLPASTSWSSGCSHTGWNQREAYWKIMFNYVVFITRVILYYRDTFPDRVNGFSLYITNSTSANIPSGGPDGYLCYRDPDTLENQQFIFDIGCHATGRDVVFYNSRAEGEIYIELCYVEVHGCPLNMYGTNCTMSCPTNCINQHCFPENGSCVFGCGSGFCLNDNCNIDKTCIDGCKSGHYGQYCDKKCNMGYFGENCNQSCAGCVSNECDRFEGLCFNYPQCQPGWQYDNRCNTQCSSGTYGLNCSQSCNGCVDNFCDHVEGFCTDTDTCKPGWKVGPKCNVVCGPGLFGFKCEGNCSTCVNLTCDKNSGKCVLGCIEGYYGDLCKLHAEETGDTASVIGGRISGALSVLIVAVFALILVRRCKKRKDMDVRRKHNHENSDHKITTKSANYTDLQRMSKNENEDSGYINTCIGTNENQYDGLGSQSAQGTNKRAMGNSISRHMNENVYEVVSESNVKTNKFVYQNAL